ncbi:hypothetical protein M408DRAFT_11214 [Serendipita vermifera MAFF 305830]|uniref:Uncharacterized protein n=1 Tax=Serendipita vermifera MAFF 305830 TaxID=933852 RepID=A0A0C3AVR0_SERVB|nr:hypothetical protein M408DRAFT_11214 [Serendipita vermifera MAFF 305830]
MSKTPFMPHNDTISTSPQKHPHVGQIDFSPCDATDLRVQLATQWLKLSSPLSLSRNGAKDWGWSTSQFVGKKTARVMWYVEFPTRERVNDWVRETMLDDPYAIEYVKSNIKETTGSDWQSEYPALIQELSKEIIAFPEGLIELEFETGGLAADEATRCICILETHGINAYFNYPDGPLWVPVANRQTTYTSLLKVTTTCRNEAFPTVKTKYLVVNQYSEEHAMVSVTVDREGSGFEEHLRALFEGECLEMVLVESVPLLKYVVLFESLVTALRAVSAWRNQTFSGSKLVWTFQVPREERESWRGGT